MFISYFVLFFLIHQWCYSVVYLYVSVCNIISLCQYFTFVLGLTSEGIYRKSGVNSRVAALCERFRRDARSLCLKEGEHQVDDVSNTLKRFFRELEEGLFTSQDGKTWLSVAGKIQKTTDY